MYSVFHPVHSVRVWLKQSLNSDELEMAYVYPIWERDDLLITR